MKLKIFSRIITISTFGAAFAFLSSCKNASESAGSDSTPPEKVAPAETTANSDSTPKQAPNTAATVPVYVINVSGKGWGIGNRTSSVLKAQNGVKKVKLSGLRATVFIEEGAVLDKDAIGKQLTAKNVTLDSAEAATISKPVGAYTIKLKGTGWSKTADKVRVALEKIDSVSSAFVNNEVELYLSNDITLDEAVIKEAVNSSGAKYISMQKESAVNL